MRRLPILLFIVCSCSSIESGRIRETKTEKKKLNPHLLNSFGTVAFDTSTFRKLKCGLYINENGTVAYKTIDNSLKFDTIKPIDVYLSTVYNADPSDSLSGGRAKMENIVDTSTLIMLSNGDFKDKKHYYNFNAMSDGGTIAIKEFK